MIRRKSAKFQKKMMTAICGFADTVRTDGSSKSLSFSENFWIQNPKSLSEEENVQNVKGNPMKHVGGVTDTGFVTDPPMH